jgi:hypothetical protein
MQARARLPTDPARASEGASDTSSCGCTVFLPEKESLAIRSELQRLSLPPKCMGLGLSMCELYGAAIARHFSRPSPTPIKLPATLHLSFSFL